jgi:hypothetical protein
VGYDGGGFKSMILTYGGQTIDLFGKEDFPDGPPEQIFLGLSGGLDSSSLLYLIGTNFPEIEVFTYAGNDANHPMDYLNAINVCQYLQEKLPKAKIHSQYIFNFAADEEPWKSKAIELIESGKKPGFASIRGVAKTLVMNHEINKAWDELCPDAIRVSGMTANPPDDEMKKYDFYDLAERRRDQNEKRKPFNGRVYQPLTNVDKKFVSGVYNEHSLMQELFPLTGSCVGSPEQQEWGTKACGKCFWCKEKEWSFGQY